MTGLNRAICLSFLPVGHTKFAPDWCFGLLKQKFRRSEVNCLDDIANVANTSAASNTAQLVGTQSGEVIVPTYDWNATLSPNLRKIPGITSYHLFRFSVENPGICDVRLYSDSETISVNLLKDPLWAPGPNLLPPIIPPIGLSEERQLYLYERIRPFCSPQCQDLVCPKPSLIETPSSVSFIPPPSSTIQPKPKSKRLCSKCHQPGHNARSCKN